MDTRILRGMCPTEREENLSLPPDRETPATSDNSLRRALPSLVAAGILLLSASCGRREATNELGATPVESRPSPTREATATPTPFHEDPYEPNDSMTRAFGPLVPGEEYQGYVDGKEDIDFFYFEIELPKTLNIALTDIPAEADYDLYLVTGEEDVLSSSGQSGREEEYIEYTTSSVGVFYIVVLPFRGFSETEPYTLRLELSPAPTPSGTDSYEPNDTFDQAAGPLVFEQTYRSYVWDEGDTDSFLLLVDQSGTFAIDLTDIPSVADYDLFLYDEAGSLLASSRRTTDREHIEHYLSPGIYYISIQSFAGFSRSESYTLQVAALGS